MWNLSTFVRKVMVPGPGALLYRFIIIIDSMTSVLNTDASLPYNHGLFESLIVEKKNKDGWGGDLLLPHYNHSEEHATHTVSKSSSTANHRFRHLWGSSYRHGLGVSVNQTTSHLRKKDLQTHLVFQLRFRPVSEASLRRNVANHCIAASSILGIIHVHIRRNPKREPSARDIPDSRSNNGHEQLINSVTNSHLHKKPRSREHLLARSSSDDLSDGSFISNEIILLLNPLRQKRNVAYRQLHRRLTKHL
ncbi:hypothetical protein CLF_110090 [Clonorchis sinensis]|uniref:Uncharacterized protein n=1 Tax=Clonorchis sinensis TaxID=79923 RepID=G7YK87_CLOSI|nr:hypothetical protein CLF_110090 [Clonorchis sinensis]